MTDSESNSIEYSISFNFITTRSPTVFGKSRNIQPSCFNCFNDSLSMYGRFGSQKNDFKSF